ncbi:MAG: hypothetical protein ACLFUG_12675, partial [Nitriliruptoraceae bacterium]
MTTACSRQAATSAWRNTVRNDAEAANAEYKKHLLDTRASRIGADRNLLDAFLFFAGQNALNARRHKAVMSEAA